MLDQQAIQKLTSLGLNQRQAQIYLALLRRAEATPSELHHLSGVPRTKIYEYLESMAAQGLCTSRSEGRQRYFRAVRPAALKAMLEANWEQEQKQRQLTATDLFTTLEDFHTSAQLQDPGLENIEVIRSREPINRTFLDLMQHARDEVLSFTRSPYAASSDVVRDRVKQVQHEALARGVDIRTVYMVETTDWEWLHGFIGELADAGEKVRLTDQLPLKMFIFDRRHVLFTLQSVPGLTGHDFSMLSIADKGLINACVDLFEMHWDRALAPDQWKSLKLQGHAEGS